MATGAVIARDVELAEKSDAVCRMGSLMLAAGTGSYRVKAAMGRVAGALGIETLECSVGLNEIILTTRESGSFRTQIVETPVPGVNADRIAALHRVSLRAGRGLTASRLHAQLDRVERQSREYPLLLVLAGSALACASFACLNHGRWQDCLAAALGAGVGKAAQLTLRRARLNHLAVVALAAILGCVVYLVAAQALGMWLPGSRHPIHETAFTSAILFLVPGFPLITAALDLARFDFVAGIPRLFYAGMVTVAAAVGAWSVAMACGLTPLEIEPFHLRWQVAAALYAAASFSGVLGFAVTFNTPLRAALVASGVGMVANTLRLTGIELGWNPLPCAVAATLVIGLFAHWFSQHLPAPRIILSVPAVLIMIPGAPTYRALVAMINRDPLGALTNGFWSLAIVMALVCGLVFARMLTDRAWISAMPEWTNMPQTRAQRILRERARRDTGSVDGSRPTAVDAG